MNFKEGKTEALLALRGRHSQEAQRMIAWKEDGIGTLDIGDEQVLRIVPAH